MQKWKDKLAPANGHIRRWDSEFLETSWWDHSYLFSTFKVDSCDMFCSFVLSLFCVLLLFLIVFVPDFHCTSKTCVLPSKNLLFLFFFWEPTLSHAVVQWMEAEDDHSTPLESVLKKEEMEPSHLLSEITSEDLLMKRNYPEFSRWWKNRIRIKKTRRIFRRFRSRQKICVALEQSSLCFSSFQMTYLDKFWFRFHFKSFVPITKLSKTTSFNFH